MLLYVVGLFHIWKILPDLYEAIEEIKKTQAVAPIPTAAPIREEEEGQIFSNCSLASSFVVSFLESLEKIDAYTRTKGGYRKVVV